MIDAQLRDLALTGVQAVGEHRAGREARFTEGTIAHFSNHVSAGVSRGVRRAEAVFEHVVHVPIDAHTCTAPNAVRCKCRAPAGTKLGGVASRRPPPSEAYINKR